MFLGQYRHNIDEKGRLTIPARFRDLLENGGYDPTVWSGFAFGFGIDRMAKERHGVEDLRDMYTNDIRFLEQFS